MSAFVVEDAVINRVISFLCDCRERDIGRMITDATGADISTREGRAQMGEAMFQLNCNAVEQRYGSGQAKEFRDLDYSFKPEQTTPIQTYKSLRCWLYQCSEGEVPDTSLLYSTMERVAGEIAGTIVCDLPEYEQAEW